MSKMIKNNIIIFNHFFMGIQSPEILPSITNKLSKLELAKYAIENWYNIRELWKLWILESENYSMKKYYIDNGDWVYSYFIETSSEIISQPIYSENSVIITVGWIWELHLSTYDDWSVKTNPNNENEYLYNNGEYIIYYDKDLNEIKRWIKGEYNADLSTEDTLVDYYWNPITWEDHKWYIKTENWLVCKTPHWLNFQIVSEHNGEKVFEVIGSKDGKFGIITSDNQFYFIDCINWIDILEINLEKQEIIAFNARFKLSKNEKSWKYELTKDEQWRIIWDIIWLEETWYKVYIDEYNDISYIYLDQNWKMLKNDHLDKWFEIKELEWFVLIKNHDWDTINYLYDKNNLKQIEFEWESVLYEDWIYFIWIDDNKKRLILDENWNFTEDLKYKVREKVKKIFWESNNIPDDLINILDNWNIEVIWKEKWIKVILDNNWKVLYIENLKWQKLESPFNLSEITSLEKYPNIKFRDTYILKAINKNWIYQFNNTDWFFSVEDEYGEFFNTHIFIDSNFNDINPINVKISWNTRLIDHENPSEELLNKWKTSIDWVYEYYIYSYRKAWVWRKIKKRYYKRTQFRLIDWKLQEIKWIYLNPEDILNNSEESIAVNSTKETITKTSVLDKLWKAIADIVLWIIQNWKN